MVHKRLLLSALAGLGFLSLALFSFAQNQDTFKARLSPVPIDGKSAPKTAGLGSVTATLAGSKLTLNGSFQGMRGNATEAHLLESKVTGVRGAPIADLTVSKAESGSLSGTVDLKAEQVDALKKGRLYVQIHSEAAPEGNVWGWLLK